jgi:hypothetical protein
MQASHIAIFAAGFIAGGIVLGGYVAHARITSVNGSIGGVLPNSEAGLLCVTVGNAVRPIRGVWREGTVGAPSGSSTGVWLRCPA